MRFHANQVSIGEFGGEFFQVSFDSEAESEDDFDLSEADHPYLLIQRQFEDDDGGVCYIETHDHDSYTGHFRLRLIDVTATRLAFEIARRENKYVEVTYNLDAQQFDELMRIAHIILACEAETTLCACGCLASWRATRTQRHGADWRPRSPEPEASVYFVNSKETLPATWRRPSPRRRPMRNFFERAGPLLSKKGTVVALLTGSLHSFQMGGSGSSFIKNCDACSSDSGLPTNHSGATKHHAMDLVGI